MITNRLASDIKDGVLCVIFQQTRSQAENRELAIELFVEPLRYALRQVPIRKKARVSKEAKLRRLEGKQQRSLLKSGRAERVPDEDYSLVSCLNFPPIFKMTAHKLFELC